MFANLAVNQIIDSFGRAVVDEFPVFAWGLRAKAHERFGYDPAGAFSADADQDGHGRSVVAPPNEDPPTEAGA